MEYIVNNQLLTYEAEGEKIIGPDKVLLDKADDLIRKTKWSSKGYSIEPFLDTTLYSQFKTNTKKLLFNLWKKAGLIFTNDFLPDQYHTIIKDHQSHLKAIEETKLIQFSEFPIDGKLFEERISELCSQKLIVKNPFDNQSIFHFRVIRPNSRDNNPLHRDVWLEDFKDCVNLYIPIAGCNELSSLLIVPESHHWPENSVERTSSGAVINGIKFNVPAVTAINRKFEILRPNPQENEVLIFSPYLIHGGSVNLHPTKTRISIEIRLWKKS